MRKLHKQVLELSVCLLRPYLAFKSVERSHGWIEKEIRRRVVGSKLGEVGFSKFLPKAADLKKRFYKSCHKTFLL